METNKEVAFVNYEILIKGGGLTMEILNNFISQLEDEIKFDCKIVENDYQRITRLEFDIEEAKQRIKKNNLLLFKLKRYIKGGKK